MKKRIGARRGLSLLLTAAMLLSCLAAALPVLAAPAGGYSYDFRTAGSDGAIETTYWNSASNRVAGWDGNQAGTGIRVTTQTGTAGYNGSDRWMQMKYESDLAPTASAVAKTQVAAFSLPNNTGAEHDGRPSGSTIHLAQDSLWEITVTYKVTKYVSPMRLDVAMDMGNLLNFNKAYSQTYPTTVARITDAGDGWQTATALYKAPVKSGVYIVLKMEDDYNRAGACVQIGHIELKPYTGSAVKLSFDSNGGSAVREQYGVPGQPIVYPVTPTISGQMFQKWEMTGGAAAPAVYPATDTTLKAVWGVPTPVATVSFYTGGGSPVSGATGNAGDPLPAEAVSTKKGFVFNGWFADHACTQPVTAFPPVDSVLYAGWIPAEGDVQSFETVGSGTGFTPVFTNNMDNTAKIKEYYEGKDWENNYSNRTEHSRFGTAVNYDGDAGNMIMAYETPANMKEASYMAAFRITDAEGGRVVVSGSKAYRVSFKYKVTSLPEGAGGRLNVYSGSLNWGTYRSNSGDLTTMGTAAEFTAVGDWQQASALLIGSAYEGAGLHIAMEMYSAANREGTTVLIDDIAVDEVYYFAITGNGDAALVKDAATAHHGTQSVQLTATTSTAAAANRVVYANSMINAALKTGADYTATAWMYSATGFDGSLWLIADPDAGDFGKGHEIAKLPVSIPAGQWVRMSHTFTLTAANYEPQSHVSFAAYGSGLVFLDELQVAAYTPQPTMVQDFEGYEDMTYAGSNAVDGTLHGTAGGRTVTALQNNTVSGTKALQLHMSSDDPADYARTVLAFDRGDHAAVTGEGYVAIFYVRSAVDREVDFVLGSTDTLDFTGGVIDAEVGATARFALTANTWQKVSLTVKNLTKPYITLGAWFEGASAANGADVFVDDIQLVNYYEPPAESLRDDTRTFDEGDLLPGDTIGLTTVGGNITASTEYNHTAGGAYSARVEAISQGGGDRAQMLVKDGQGQTVRLEQGKNYRVSFWLYTPDITTSFKYWLTADESTTGYTSTAQKNDGLLFETNEAAGEEGPYTKGVWHRVTRTLMNVPHGGNLRIGLCGSYRANMIIFIDDIQVREVKVYPPDPTAEEQSFELYDVEDDPFVLRNMASVSDKFAHSGSKSLECTVQSTSQTDSNQFYLVDASTGAPYELTVGKPYTVSFWVYIPRSQSPYLRLNYWMLCSDELRMVTDAAKIDAGEYTMGKSELVVTCDEWVQLRQTIVATNGQYLQFGLTDTESDGAGLKYYVDDVRVDEAKWATVTFDGNGGEVSVDDAKGIVGEPLAAPEMEDPYRVGYEFLGWYLDKTCTKAFTFGDTVLETEAVTLYAGWQEWKEPPVPEKYYQTVWNEEKVWTGKAENPLIPNTAASELRDPLPVEMKPQTPVEEPVEENSSAWIILLIVIAAVVVVGGGATIWAVVRVKAKKGGAR